MTNPQLLKPNSVSSFILRVGKCIPLVVSRARSTWICVVNFCARILHKFNRSGQEILPLLSSVLPLSSTLCSLLAADWLEGKWGMRFCRLICQQIATDGPLSNGFSKLLFQGRANPFYQIAALSSSFPPFQVPLSSLSLCASLSSRHQFSSDFIYLSLHCPSVSHRRLLFLFSYDFILAFSAFHPTLHTPRLYLRLCVCSVSWLSLALGLAPGEN